MNFRKTAWLLLIVSCFTTAHSQTIKKLSRPEKDFETFWHTFKDHYAFFKLKGVNWDSMYTAFRPRVNGKTKEKELVALLGQMVTPLHDGHITISKGDDILFNVKKPSYFKQEFKGLEKEFWQMVNNTLTQQHFTPPAGVGPVFRDAALYYTAQDPAVGYIRISRCFANPESIFDDAKEAADTRLMLSLFDSLLTAFAHTKALIIDMRTNGGGHGGIELASRFARTKLLTHFKAIRRKGGYENFTPPDSVYLLPNNGVRYLQPLVILTNDKTASSAEDFTVSLYRQPGVTVIGTNTSGMLSDMFSGSLSGGISFTLSNQRYYTVNKQLLEDAGVPVTIDVKNTKQDIEKNADPVLIKALEVLKR
jgi:carboxyl-terminal processing protease